MKIKEIKKIWEGNGKSIHAFIGEDGTAAKSWGNDGWFGTLNVGDELPEIMQKPSKQPGHENEKETWLIPKAKDKKSFGGFQNAPRFSPDEQERAKMPSFCVSYAKDTFNNLFSAKGIPADKAGQWIDELARSLFVTMQTLRGMVDKPILTETAKPTKAPETNAVTPQPPSANMPSVAPTKPARKPKVTPAKQDTPAPAPAIQKPASVPVTPAKATSKPAAKVVSKDMEPLQQITKDALEKAFAQQGINLAAVEVLLNAVKPVWTQASRKLALDIFQELKNGIEKEAICDKYGCTWHADGTITEG